MLSDTLLTAAAADAVVAMPRRVVLFFQYRSLLESAAVDYCNFVAWKEVLDAFGYATLDLNTCIDDFALKSPAEIMTALCPFTTMAEWAPLLNKRDVRLERDVGELCYTEVLPLRGLKDFLIDCAKQSNCTVVLLSPFRETLSRQLLSRSELGAFVDTVQCYTEREFALLDALERLNIRPPRIPDNLRHNWEGAEETAANEAEPVTLLTFETDVEGVAHASQYGIASVAVGYNRLSTSTSDTRAPAGQEKDRTSVTDSAMPTSDPDEHPRKALDEAKMLQSGAALVIQDYTTLKYEYLKYIQLQR